MTTAEPDALVVDRDSDDGFIRFGQPMIDGQATRSAFVSVPVSIAANADFTLRFLNVAADINGDGKFQSYSAGDRTQDEWVVVNLPVSLPPGSSEVLSSPFIVVDIAKFSEGFCARATLTTEPIEPALFDGVGGWDGSGPEGGFLRGETEDHCVQAQTFPWQETGTGTFIPPPVTPLPVVKLPVPKDPKKTPPNKPPPFIEPELKRKKIPPQDPPGKNPEDDKPPRRDAIFTEVLKRNNYIPRDQGVKISTAKQGPNECVPTATANSLKYLLDKRRKDKPSAPTVPVESQSAEQWRDFFKEKMSTDPVDGTNINPTDPGDKGFLHGKAAFNALYQAQTMTTGSGLETTFRYGDPRPVRPHGASYRVQSHGQRRVGAGNQ
ncbi:MAG: hypothetical protein K8R69_12035 [Deltaproteobacteria bacterium]|nr:hypothetical protein [Deltaproteobacteria bacterium]